MGLDMYLYKEFYIGANYAHREITGNINILEKGEKIDINFNEISEIKCLVKTWRKANQIHKWFVAHVQEGVDDCSEYKVTNNQLLALKEVLKKVVKDKKTAFYWIDCKETLEFLETLDLESSTWGVDFIYKSSW